MESKADFPVGFSSSHSPDLSAGWHAPRPSPTPFCLRTCVLSLFRSESERAAYCPLPSQLRAPSLPGDQRFLSHSRFLLSPSTTSPGGPVKHKALKLGKCRVCREVPEMSPLPTVAQRPRVSSEELSNASRVSARRQSSPAWREPCSPSPGSARPSSLHELPRWVGRCTAQASCWRAHPSLPSAPRPCSRPQPWPRLMWSEGRLILREGTWCLKQQCPSTWPEPPLKWAAVWGSHYPSSRPLGPQCQSCVQPRALPARPCFLPLSFLGGHTQC